VTGACLLDVLVEGPGEPEPLLIGVRPGSCPSQLASSRRHRDRAPGVLADRVEMRLAALVDVVAEHVRTDGGECHDGPR
jgi:hypothetical protein